MTNPSATSRYPVAPLSKDVWTLGVVQSQIHPATDRADQDRNLQHMLKCVDKSFHIGIGPDLLLFHEFPISGWDMWDRDQALERCIEIPGPETDVIAAKAKEYNTWIAFGAYVRDPDWPGHVLSVTSLISPEGEIVAKHWKARNVKGMFPGFELFTTTIYDVLDEYVERYGADAVLPIAQTPLGNITLSSTQHEPELMRALSIKGAEVILRTASGSFHPVDVAATALHNRVYVAIANNSLLLKDGPWFEDQGAGDSGIYGPDGHAMALAESKAECLITARIPIRTFREGHRLPDVHWELVEDVFTGYENRFPPNMFASYQPTSLGDASRYVMGQARRP